jgi:hypothetical protein
LLSLLGDTLINYKQGAYSMRFIKLALSGILGFAVMSSAQAKTLVYDLVNLNSMNAQVHYDRLDFFGATSAKVTIDKNTQTPDLTISSLEINFPNAGKFTATNFQKTTNNTYRAIVGSAWVFREVFVDVDGPLLVDSPFHIRASVSERQSFINPTMETQGSPLFDAIGMLRDITPIQIADTGSTLVNGKTLTLSLQSRLGFNDNHSNFGFVISAFWLGKGQKNLVLPFGSPTDGDRFEAISLIIDETQGPNNQQIRVKFRDSSGNTPFSPTLPLKVLLDQAYGPT